MLCAGSFDINFFYADTQRFHQVVCIPVSALAGPEAGHGDAVNVFSVQSQFVHGFHSHHQCESGIQASGDAQNEFGNMGLMQALGKAGHLNGKDFFAALVHIAGRRYKRMGIDGSRQLEFFVGHEMEIQFGIGQRFLNEIIVGQTLREQAFNVDL
ncbi:MAG: hypothetical protein BWX93_01959 [Bacteroidetes bacterium ADurb.Bin139]|nr:MAG: hypothetical protein BWX93_01959 [Bacteroidetes bacterium ADurb.Bin139]